MLEQIVTRAPGDQEVVTTNALIAAETVFILVVVLSALKFGSWLRQLERAAR